MLTPTTKLTPDQSADLLKTMVQSREPFFYGRYGDGYLECVYQLRSGHTRDMEKYSKELAMELQASWAQLRFIHTNGMPLVIADWHSAKFNAKELGAYPEQWGTMMEGVRDTATFVNYEALMIDRSSPNVREFYAAVKADKRKKVVIGPRAWTGADTLMGATHIPIPDRGLWDHLPTISNELNRLQPELVLYGSGMCGTIPIVRYVAANPGTTSLNIGSSLDPLFIGRTRHTQLDKKVARTIFRSIL